MTTLLVMGVGGAVGCIVGGVLADRWGRTTLTALAMLVGGACALGVGFFIRRESVFIVNCLLCLRRYSRCRLCTIFLERHGIGTAKPHWNNVDCANLCGRTTDRGD